MCNFAAELKHVANKEKLVDIQWDNIIARAFLKLSKKARYKLNRQSAYPEIKKLADEVGVISEGAYNNVKYFEEMVDKSGARGFEPSLLYVYNDAETGYTNCMERLIHSNRAVTCEAYIAVFPQFKGRVEYIEEHYPNMPFYCIDNSHNNGGKRVTNEEAKLWDCSMTEDLQQKIYAIKQSYIDSGMLTAEQIEALQ